MKKCLSLVCAAFIAVGMTGIFVKARAAETVYDGPDFFDDFQSYKVAADADYNPKQLKAKWGNGYLDAANAEEEDQSCVPTRYQVTTDPSDANNKVLLFDGIPNSESFFYMTIKDENSKLIRVKNFELSFKFRLADGVQNACWFGTACRKDTDTRFNGCNNVMMGARFWNQTSVSPYGQRNLGQSGIGVSFKNEDRTGEPQNFTSEDVYAAWYTYKLVANDNKFDMYINDSHIGGCDIKQTSSNKHGYLSFVGCVAKVYIDDFRMTNNDTTAPDGSIDPPDPGSSEDPGDESGTSSGSSASENAPALTGASSVTVKKGSGEAVVIGLDTKGQEIIKVDRDKRAVLSGYFSYENGRFTLSGEYIKNLAAKAGTYKFTVTTDGGSVDFTLLVKESSGCGGGCASAIAGLSFGGVALVAAVALLGKKKRK